MEQIEDNAGLLDVLVEVVHEPARGLEVYVTLLGLTHDLLPPPHFLDAKISLQLIIKRDKRTHSPNRSSSVEEE